MKKILVFFLSLALLFSIAGCGSKKEVIRPANTDIRLLEVDDAENFRLADYTLYLKRGERFYGLNSLPAEKRNSEFGMMRYNAEYIMACERAKVDLGDLPTSARTDNMEEYVWISGEAMMLLGNVPVPVIEDKDSLVVFNGTFNGPLTSNPPQILELAECVFEGYTFRAERGMWTYDVFIYDAYTGKAISLYESEWESLKIHDESGKEYSKHQLSGQGRVGWCWDGLEYGTTYIASWDDSESGTKMELPVVADSYIYTSPKYYTLYASNYNEDCAEFEITDIPTGLYCIRLGGNAGNGFIEIK